MIPTVLRRFVAATLFLAALVAAPAPADARRHRHAASADAATADGAPAGFDFYLLSLSVAPTFCRLSPRNASLEECQALTEEGYEQTPLTVHGLWPNRAHVPVRAQPHDCGGGDLGPLPPALAADLRRYMPGGSRLEQHEWQTHGTCSGLSPADYFGTAVRLAQAVDGTVGAELRGRHAFGGAVGVADLVAAVAAHDPALAASLVVDCRIPPGGGPSLISEIRVTLSRDFTPVPASSVGFGQNSGCQGGAGTLPRVTR